MIVLDTSALLIWTLDPTQLSPLASQAISKTGRIVISSISIWEIGLKVNRGKLQLPQTIPEYVEHLLKPDRLEILPVDIQEWLGNLRLSWEGSYPVDRTIVALAKRCNCPCPLTFPWHFQHGHPGEIVYRQLGLHRIAGDEIA